MDKKKIEIVPNIECQMREETAFRDDETPHFYTIGKR